MVKQLKSNNEISDDNTICSESICCRDLITYYGEISVHGDPQASREATVLAIDSNDDYLLTLSTCDIVPNGSKVHHITKY